MPYIIGLQQMNARLLNLIRALPDEIKDALTEEAKIILIEAQRRTPVKTGALKASGKLQDYEREGFQTTVPITFGDPTPYYAIYVHEDLEARHPNGGQAKFLESATLEASAGLSVRVGKRIQIERLAQ